MWVLLIGFVVCAAVVGLLLFNGATPPSNRGKPPTAPRPAAPPSPATGPSLFHVEADNARVMREIEAEMEAEVARLIPEMEAEAARLARETEAQAERVDQQHAEMIEALEAAEAEPAAPDRISRADYVPKEAEERYLTRDDAGLPTLRLVDAGDRLALWSPIGNGALINPKGPGIRQRLGLCSSYARGKDHYPSAYKVADLSKGRWVDLLREPDNRYDPNAVAMCAPGSLVSFAYVQRGRAPAVAKRMDAGEDMAGVVMRGSPRGDTEEITHVLIGRRTDLAAMLDG